MSRKITMTERGSCAMLVKNAEGKTVCNALSYNKWREYGCWGCQFYKNKNIYKAEHDGKTYEEVVMDSEEREGLEKQFQRGE